MDPKDSDIELAKLETEIIDQQKVLKHLQKNLEEKIKNVEKENEENNYRYLDTLKDSKELEIRLE